MATTYRIESSDFHNGNVRAAGLTLAQVMRNGGSALACGGGCECGGNVLIDEETDKPIRIERLPRAVLDGTREPTREELDAAE